VHVVSRVLVEQFEKRTGLQIRAYIRH
jgi:hypothetical protein